MMQQSKSRFDGQLPATQKQHFELAAELGGFKSLSEFIFTAAQKEADKIIKRQGSFGLIAEGKRGGDEPLCF